MPAGVTILSDPQSSPASPRPPRFVSVVSTPLDRAREEFDASRAEFLAIQGEDEKGEDHGAPFRELMKSVGRVNRT